MLHGTNVSEACQVLHDVLLEKYGVCFPVIVRVVGEQRWCGKTQNERNEKNTRRLGNGCKDSRTHTMLTVCTENYTIRQ